MDAEHDLHVPNMDRIREVTQPSGGPAKPGWATHAPTWTLAVSNAPAPRSLNVAAYLRTHQLLSIGRTKAEQSQAIRSGPTRVGAAAPIRPYPLAAKAVTAPSTHRRPRNRSTNASRCRAGHPHPLEGMGTSAAAARQGDQFRDQNEVISAPGPPTPQCGRATLRGGSAKSTPRRGYRGSAAGRRGPRIRPRMTPTRHRTSGGSCIRDGRGGISSRGCRGAGLLGKAALRQESRSARRKDPPRTRSLVSRPPTPQHRAPSVLRVGVGTAPRGRRPSGGSPTPGPGSWSTEPCLVRTAPLRPRPRPVGHRDQGEEARRSRR